MAKYIVDGQEYERKEDIPDIGHWKRSADNNYYGLSSEKDKLPDYAAVGTFAITDKFEVAVFINGEWHWKSDEEDE